MEITHLTLSINFMCVKKLESTKKDTLWDVGSIILTHVLIHAATAIRHSARDRCSIQNTQTGLTKYILPKGAIRKHFEYLSHDKAE